MLPFLSPFDDVGVDLIAERLTALQGNDSEFTDRNRFRLVHNQIGIPFNPPCLLTFYEVILPAKHGLVKASFCGGTVFSESGCRHRRAAASDNCWRCGRRCALNMCRQTYQASNSWRSAYFCGAGSVHSGSEKAVRRRKSLQALSPGHR